MADELVIFGTPFPSSENDNKDYVPIWKQKGVSSKGHKRLHGAFEGGFSAGYFNTVGTKEGWKPSEFISSRENRHAKLDFSAENYMDDEDLIELNHKNLLFISPKSMTFLPDSRTVLSGFISKYLKKSDSSSKGFEADTSSLHKISDDIEAIDNVVDDVLRIAFGNTIMFSCANNIETIDIINDFVPKKIKLRAESTHCPGPKSFQAINDISTISDVDEKTASAALKGFMPFSEDSEKQDRYIKYLRYCLNNTDKTNSSKFSLFLDDREREEFIMSAQIFKPSSSAISARFETSSKPLVQQIQLQPGLSKPEYTKKLPQKLENYQSFSNSNLNEKLKSPINSSRFTFSWSPNSLLCKRFNVALPDHCNVGSSADVASVKPILSGESVDQLINMVLKDTKSIINLDLEDEKINVADNEFSSLPSDALFDEVFGSINPIAKPNSNRNKASDYFCD